MSAIRERVLKAVDNDDLTWRYAGTRTYYRWWLTETNYRTLTSSERRHLKAMLESGELKHRQGWRHGGIERATQPEPPEEGS